LLPTYNRAAYLGAAVQSAFNQTFSDFELIVVDDGSTDNTAEVIHSFRDPRLRFLQQANRGISGALNSGLAAARGHYIAILNSDDVWLPTLLATLAPVLESAATVGMAYSRAQAMDSKGQLLPRTAGAPPKYSGDMLKSLLYGDHICTITTLFRHDLVIEAGGWDERLIANEDWDLWLRMARLSRFVFVDEVLAYFRVHPGRITGSVSQHFVRLVADRIRVVDKVYAQADLPLHIMQMRSLAYANVYTDVGLRWLNAGDWREALRYLIHAVQIAPRSRQALLRIIMRIVYQRMLSQQTWGVRVVNGLVRRRQQ